MMKEVFETAKTKMGKTIHALQQEYGAIRAGRAYPQVLNQLASVAATEARVLTIAPWDKSVLKPIEKAIQASDIGINPQNDGSVIRLTFPPLTEDRRKELAKDVQKIAEEAKVATRNIRRDCMEKLKTMKKNSDITEDDLKDGEKEIQKITDNFIKDIDEIAAAKEKEILEI